MLVRLMGGTLTAKSAPGVGSTFTVHLRFALPTAQPADVGGYPNVEALRCCLIGGEQPLTDDLTASLRHAGATVESARDVAAAAAMSRSAGLTLWVILPDQPVPPLPELRAMAAGGGKAEVRFVIVRYGAGNPPRLDARDLVTLDTDLLARQPLFRALSLAAGRTVQEAAGDAGEATEPLLVAPPYYEAKLQGRLILVAEDNETNRKVILHQLHLVGFAAEVCRNGREALERWRSGDFALVLTDLHMPEMDGYQLAAAIRAEQSALQHTPIIALTANALLEEEERCRAAGMDAYLTKPVRLPHLKAAIEAWLGPTPEPGATQPLPVIPVDLQVLMECVGDDPVIVAEVLRAFRKSAAEASAEISNAVRAGSMHGVADAAHRLKAAARSIGGSRLGQLCADIEHAAQDGQKADLDTLLPRFRAELLAVDNFLAAR